MISSGLKRIATSLPDPWQQEMKCAFFARQIRGGRFLTDEVEYDMLVTSNGSGTTAMSVRIDALESPWPMRMVKFDAEVHEASVVAGMEQFVLRDHPVIVLGDSPGAPEAFLLERGHRRCDIDGSSNLIFEAA